MPLHPDGEMWDIYENSSRRKMYTYKEITVDGLYCFGWQHFNQTRLYIPLHYHKDCFEFHYIQEGSITFQVDGKTYTVNSGQVFVNYPNEMHGADLELLLGHKMFWFDLKVQKRILGLSEQATRILLKRLSQINQRVLPADAGMRTAIGEVFAHVCSQDSYGKQYAGNQMAYFLHRLIQNDTPLKGKEISIEIQQVVDYMHAHLHHCVDLGEIAAAVGYSLPNLKLKFKKQMGVSPAHFYTSLRINQAKRLLQQGYSVTETANALDFSTPNYFSTVFHRITNMTPSDYRKKHHL